MALASHNTMTYLSPTKWWMKIFNFMSKCQSVSIEEQYDLHGVRVFDLRISYDKNDNPQFRHGLTTYKGDVESVLSYLNSKSDVLVRLLLEKSINKLDGLELLFIKDCMKWELLYSNILFFAGNRKYDWYKLYSFPDKEKDIEHLYSSMQGNKLDDLFPYYYAKKNNRNNLDKEWGKSILMIDFVHIK